MASGQIRDDMLFSKEDNVLFNYFLNKN
jgi:hypothetical protein